MQQKSTTNLKKLFGVGLKSLMNLQVGMMLLLVVSIIYFLGYDTAYVSSNKKLTELETKRKTLDDELQKKRQEAEKLKQWESELKGIETQIPKLKAGESARVLAITESKKVADLAQGIGRDAEKFPPLPEPHNKLTVLGFNLVSEQKVQVGDDAVPKTLDNKTPAAAPPPAAGSGGADAEAAAKPLLFSKFSYELRLKGTYPALADLLNQVGQSDQLISIEKVIMKQHLEGESSGSNASGPNSPGSRSGGSANTDNPETAGDSVLLEMIMLFSLYFHEPNQ
jgi:Tfp pilus assembly protein PilO